MSWGWFDPKGERTEELISEIPTPKNLEEYRKISSLSLHQILHYQESSDPHWKRPKELNGNVDIDREISNNIDNLGSFSWLKLKDTPDLNAGGEKMLDWTITCQDRNKEGGNEGPTSCVKAQGLMPCSPQRLVDIICTNNILDRKKWDENVKGMEIIEDFGKEMSILYRTYKSPFMGIAGRDFIIMNGLFESKDTYITYQTSINYPSFKGADPSAVRGVVKAGFIIEKIEGNPQLCRCIRFVWLNPRGMIPNWVVQASKGLAGSGMLKIRQAVRVDLKERPDFDARVVEIKKSESSRDNSPSKSESISLIQYADRQDPIRKLERKDSFEWSPENEKGKAHSIEFPLPKTSSEEFHSQIIKHKQQKELKDQELSMKLQRRQMIAQKTQELNQMTESHVDQLLRTLSSIQSELQQSSDVVERLYVEVQQEKQERKRLCELVEKQQEELRRNKLEKMEELALIHHRASASPKMSWGMIGLAVLWPFITYALADFIRKRRSRK
eukprot:TRINITY_DN3336_c0_g1_i1.p1 TRINITY_DN3336_c0_g1~~TRINITY_DN3336_c0_g1_i1.p1  ORF type:complete len:507 (-),score=170.61 TRINITY_DN3336_c0_g1_i1:13-1509(-)